MPFNSSYAIPSVMPIPQSSVTMNPYPYLNKISINICGIRKPTKYFWPIFLHDMSLIPQLTSSLAASNQ